jgi:ribosomal protein S18 acetylase RimI-like enzyme
MVRDEVAAYQAKVRPYRPGDRQALHDIAGDTAFFGQPVEVFMEDRQPFLDTFVAYYTDYEADFAWVAEAGGLVVGYLTGCPDASRQARVLRRRIVPRVLLRLVSGRYTVGSKTAGYVLRLVLSLLRGEYPRPDRTIYPAHLHVNVADGWRGRGLGRRLLTAYLGQLRRVGVPGVHLGTTTLNHAAVHLYRALGFELLASHRSRLWEGVIGEPVENLSFGKRLSSQDADRG